MSRRDPPAFLRYAVAVACWLAATLAYRVFAPVLGPRVPFIFAWPAVILAAWFGGLWPGLLVVVASAAGAILLPWFDLPLGTASGAVSLALYVTGAVAVAFLCEQLRRERHRAEAVETSRALLGAVVESSDDAIFSKDMDGRITSWNRGAERVYGYTASEVIGRHAALLSPPDHADDADRILVQIRRGQAVTPHETVRLTKDGRTIVVALTVSPVRDGEGQLIGASVIARDITAARQQSEERRRQRELLEKIIDHAPIGVAVASVPDFRFVLANATYTRSLGLSDGALEGRTIAEAFPPAIVAASRPILEKAARGEALSLREYPASLGPDREETWWNAELLPLFDADGRLHAILGLSQDVTESVLARRRIEQLAVSAEERAREAEAARDAAEAASRAKDEFLAVVSHELRTPLTTIVAWSQLLRRGALDEPTTTRALEVIERNAKSQAQLIDDLLDVSRIIAGRMRLEVRPTDVLPVVEAALDAVRPAADAKSIPVDRVLDSHTGLVAGDAERLQQVVWNLLSNAIKFTPKGGRVQVHLTRVDSRVQLVVSDTGQGIEPELLPYIFDRFWQADASTRRVHGGLGLGLAITRHLVELHGGTIRAESPGAGQGATITVELPVMVTARRDRPARGALTSETAHDARRTRLDGVRVLCVDDDRDTCEMLEALLEGCGARVETAGSAQEALAALDRFPADVLVSDIGMPDVDGYMLMERVRSRERARGGERLPAVALTAYAQTDERLRSLAAGYQMHVSKPVDPTELVVVIASLVDRARPSATETIPQEEGT